MLKDNEKFAKTSKEQKEQKNEQNGKRKINYNNIIIKSIVEIIFPVMLLVVFLSVIFYYNTINSVSEQILNSNLSDLKSVSDMYDKTFESIEGISNKLFSDGTTEMFFLAENPYYSVREYNLGVKEKIKSIDNLYDYIYSVYVYVQNGEGEFFVSSKVQSDIVENVETLEDSFWVKKTRNEKREDGIYFYFRSLDDNYPFLLTVDKEFTKGKNRCVISLNIDLRELNSFIMPEKPEKFYILREDKIIYNRYMKEMFCDISDNEILKASKSFKGDASQIVKSDRGDFVVSRIKSSKYDWEYAVVNSADMFSTQAKSKRLIFFLMIVVTLLLCGFIVIKYVLGVYYPIKQIENLMSGKALDKKKSSPEIESISDKIISFANINEELKNELELKLYNLKKWQLVSLNAQINPHFVFNVMNTIYMQSISDFKTDRKTSEMLLKISKYLRYILENENDLEEIETEMYYNEIYVDFLMERYDEIKKLKWEIPDEIKSCKILKLCLQPVLENAVYHGLVEKKGNDGFVSIKGELLNNAIVISVSDNGIGMTEEKIKELSLLINSENVNSEHIGLYNINKRLKIMFGEKYGIEIKSVYGEGTTVKIKFPKIL